MNCQRIYIALIALALAQVSCAIPVSPRVPTVAPSVPTVQPAKLPTVQIVPTQAPEWTATVKLPTVNVRAAPNGKVIGSLSVGTTVTVRQCVGNWCEITEPAGYIFRGCLSDNPEKLGCSAK